MKAKKPTKEDQRKQRIMQRLRGSPWLYPAKTAKKPAKGAKK